MEPWVTRGGELPHHWGVFWEVYKEVGCGFLEAVYQECLSMEFASKTFRVSRKVHSVLYYKGQPSIRSMCLTSYVLTKSS